MIGDEEKEQRSELHFLSPIPAFIIEALILMFPRAAGSFSPLSPLQQRH